MSIACNSNSFIQCETRNTFGICFGRYSYISYKTLKTIFKLIRVYVLTGAFGRVSLISSVQQVPINYNALPNENAC